MIAEHAFEKRYEKNWLPNIGNRNNRKSGKGRSPWNAFTFVLTVFMPHGKTEFEFSFFKFSNSVDAMFLYPAALSTGLEIKKKFGR